MNENKMVIKRVEEERDELNRKVNRLKSTVDHLNKNNDITEEHKTLLRGQLCVMYQYLQILEQRLALFEQDVK